MQITFDTWTLVFLVAAAQGMFIALILWRWRQGSRQGNRLLSALLTLFSLSMGEYVMYWTNAVYQYPWVTNLSVNFPMLYGALIWLYLRTIYEGKRVGWSDSWHLALAILATLPFVPWYLADPELKRQVINGTATFPWNGLAVRIQFWVRMAYMAGICFWNIRYVARQPVVGDTARWARWLVACQAVFLFAYISYFILIRLPGFKPIWDYQISAVMTLMIYLIACMGYVQPGVFDGMKWLESGSPAKYRNSGLTSDASRSLLQHLELLMREERIYHDPEIGLEKLAQRLQASKHHVSQVINEHLGMSFFEYVNSLRIEEARQLLSETSKSDLNVIEVAYAVGFNNKVSFNAAFKRWTGMTPTEFRRSHGTSDESGALPRASQ